MNPLKHSIKHLTDRIQNPNLYRARPACLYIIHVSQVVKNHSDPEDCGYINNFYKCTKLGRQIKKRECRSCKLHNPLNNGNKQS